MKDRDRDNIIFPMGRGLEKYTKVQEITNDIFKAEKLFISILSVDFLPEATLKYRKDLEAKWIEVIPTLDNVKSISLRHKVDQKFFEAVCCMKNLECLTFWTSTVEDISSITKLKALKRLDIDNFSRLADISPLLKLEKLEILTVSNSLKITNYEVIGHLTNLIGLAIQGDQIAPRNLRLKSLKPFAKLKVLKHLDLSSTTVIDESYETLLNMESLQRFDLTTVIKKPLREKIKTHPKLTSGFFMDYDWDNKKLYDGKEW
jgi:Leucine-rich repeat (LRR) protein